MNAPHHIAKRAGRIAWSVFFVLAVVAYVGLIAGEARAQTSAPAAPSEYFQSFGQDGSIAALRIFQAPCTDKKVVAQLRDKALDVRRFKASVLTYGGRNWASCWIDIRQLVFSIDEEGSPFQAVPRSLFKDNTI